MKGGEMPDGDGNTKAEETATPLHAYKDGRSEDVQQGDLGVAPDGSKLPEDADQPGQYQDGGPGGRDPGESGPEPAGEGSEVGDSGIGVPTGAVDGPDEGGPGLGQEPDDKPTRGA